MSCSHRPQDTLQPRAHAGWFSVIGVALGAGRPPSLPSGTPFLGATSKDVKIENDKERERDIEVHSKDPLQASRAPPPRFEQEDVTMVASFAAH
mmetsp:Transcript_37481/g.99624  ORF Transcript_37481/g.99624 Transcript_37481/m.99624 type:complete len:94 (-) Transcript_37481:1903-2184(-)